MVNAIHQRCTTVAEGDFKWDDVHVFAEPGVIHAVLAWMMVLKGAIK